jgi:hypothetical protein
MTPSLIGTSLILCPPEHRKATNGYTGRNAGGGHAPRGIQMNQLIPY